jgi:quinol monooxygenase YgiN
MKRIVKKEAWYGIFCLLLLLFVVGSFAGNRTANNDETLAIVATLTVKPEFKDEVLAAIKTVVDATRKEPGNIFYDVFEDINNPLKFVFIETWRSQAAIDFHVNTPHFIEFVRVVEGKTTLEVTTLRQKF